MTEEPPNVASNLWDPVDDDTDYGAHGSFDDRARDRSYQLWLTTHRRTLLVAVLAALSLAASIVSRLVGRDSTSDA